MLIELQRVQTTGETTPIAISAPAVGALFGSNQNPTASIIRMLDGRGFTIDGDCRMLAERLKAAGAILIEFQRAQTLSEGEDRPIFFSPSAPAAVFESEQSGSTVVRMADGRGFIVLGSYQDIKNKLGATVQGSDDDLVAVWPPRSELDMN